MTERHRPRRLAELVGQPAAVEQLQTFLAAPYSTAFLFAGETGVGKTTAALAIAAELGSVEFGGLHQVKSGEQDAETVEAVLQNLRYTPMVGSRWKVVIVDEADYASVKARQLWLSALEDLPPYSVIVFTTNHAEKFEQRLLDRCERIHFGSSPDLAAEAQDLVDRIWAREGLAGEAPRAQDLPGIVERDQLSFRRVVRALEPIVRRVKAGGPHPTTRPTTEASQAPRRFRPIAVSPPPAPPCPTSPAIAEPAATVEPTAKPCRRCGTTGGGVDRRSGKPTRTRGLCRHCYNNHGRKEIVPVQGEARCSA